MGHAGYECDMGPKRGGTMWLAEPKGKPDV